MIIIFDHFGVFVASLSGALLAARKEMDLVGFFVLGIVTGIGGGTIRDIILDLPVFWVNQPSYLTVSIVAAFIAYRFAREALSGWRRVGILWFDAAAMALFAATGSLKAQNADVQWMIAILMGVITASAGGLIRDTIAQDTPYIMRGDIYATAAVLGGMVVVASAYLGFSDPISLTLGFLAAFILRALAIVFNLKLSAVKRIQDE